jgi:hypothetical protein
MRDMTDVSAPWVARAVEDNEAEFLLALGRAGGARERRDDAEIAWVIGGSPIAYHNCVVRADLEPERADAAITESQNLMRTSGVAGSWHVGPSMRPTDLGARLEAHGFEGGPEPGMAADLRALPDVEAPTDVRISRVVTDTCLDAYEQVLSLGFGEGPPEAAWVREMYARIGVGDDVPWRHYVGLAGGDPVACASVFLAAGVAGLYFVCTVPDARRRGIGSSPMGQPMYERLGFREVCAVNVYEWSPFTRLSRRGR